MKPRNTQKRDEQQARARRRYQDGNAVYFDEITPRVIQYAKALPSRLRHDPATLDKYRGQGICPLCPPGTPARPLEPHHLAAGSKGRSDEHCNLLAICRRCHDRVQSDSNATREVWLAKWTQDPSLCDWLRLIILFGRKPFDTLDG